MKIFLTILYTLLSFFVSPVVAAECDSIGDIGDRISCYKEVLGKLGNTGKTLSSQISSFNAQISLTTLKISQTEDKIGLLSGRIVQLEGSLESLTDAFSQRAVETYKMARVGDPLLMIISSEDLSEAVSRFFYLKKIQEADRELLQRLQGAQNTYKGEKLDQEELQIQLEEQKSELAKQKTAKAYLLIATKNDEKKYQQLLSKARAEYEAIQAIIAGKGKETEIGKVSEGNRIASLISGSSCNSDGTHLHFIVRNESGTTENPFIFLNSNMGYRNCSGSSCGSGDGDVFNPSGNWSWPISPEITFSQGYGNTWAVRNTWVGRIYSFHNGIDISGSSNEIKAVKSGTLYQGAYSVGCLLRYVRVDHDDSDLDTLYLHVNY